MSLEEGTLFILYLMILILAAARLLSGKGGRVSRRFRTGRAMTIGDRQMQEDSYGICQSADAFLAVLADGMGRHYGGRVSSRTAVDTMKDMFRQYRRSEAPAYFFRRAFHQMNRAILEQLDDGRGGASVGAVLIRDGRLHYAVAGNIRIAVFRKGDLIPVSSGHTIGVLAGDRFVEGRITREQALRMLDDTRLYNYVGQDGFREIEFVDTPIRLKDRDIVALMSDGLYEGLEWRAIEEILSSKKKCQQKAYDIVEMINADSRKGKDNAGIVLVEVAL